MNLLSRHTLKFLLESEKEARQIRSRKNRILVSNSKGKALFGKKENPFAFLSEALYPDKLLKLKQAYQTAAPFSIEIELPSKTYQITLRPIKKFVLIIADDISEKVQIQTLLDEQRNLFQDAFDQSEFGMYILQGDGRFVFANETLCQWLQTTSDQIRKENIQKYIDGSIDQLRSKETGKIKNSDFLLRQVPFDSEGQGFFLGMVTPQQKDPSSVKNNDVSFDRAPVGIIWVDVADMSVQKANPMALRLTGLTADNLEGQKLSSLLDEGEDLLNLKLSKLIMHAQKMEKCELSFHSSDGRSHSVMAYIVPNEENDEIVRFAFYLTDLNEKKTLQLQMAHAQKMQAMGQLAGGVAHDFNNLLTAIIGFSDLLLQKHGMGDPSFADIMQIKHNANRASSLVGQLLAFSRKQPLKPKLLDLADEFSDLSALLHRSIGPKVNLVTEHESGLGYIKFDPNQLTQVFLNLAVNARDAMPDGGTLTIRSHVEHIKKARLVGSETLIAGSYVVIVVSDTGCGIEKENLGRIFEPFFTTKEGVAGSGTGLGLSTVYGIISQTDGYIDVSSTVGKGTTFTIYLPRFEKEEKAKKVEKKHIPLALQKATILLVEDEDAVRMFSARVLRNKGFTVIEYTNAEEALAEIEKGTPIDLLLTDMMMPGMDGETLATLAKEKHPEIKVILMSGYSEDFARHGKDESKTFSFLPKPFSLDTLVEKVKEILHND